METAISKHMETAVNFPSNCAMPEMDPALLAELLREALREGKSPYLTVVSNSMSPLIRRSDQIKLAPITTEQLRPGDIIVYEGPANLITHRFWGFVTDRDQTQIVTRGDRPQHFDKPFAPTHLVGQVIGRRRKQQFLDLAQGIGKRLNNHLASVARLEIRLFASSPAVTDNMRIELPESGRFSTTNNNLLVRIIRRILYSWAIILTLAITFISFVVNKDIED